MRSSSPVSAPVRHARTAGVLYLLIIVCGIGGAGLVRGPLVVEGDAAQTVANLLAAELAFRLSLLADVVMALSDVALAALLYFLLRPISQTLSLLAMVFRLVQAAILGLNLLTLHTAGALLHDGSLPAGQRDAWVMRLLDAHAAGYDLGLFFFGVDCLLVGVLVIRAGFLPRTVGGMMLAAGLVYLVGSAVHVVAPVWLGALAPAYLVPVLAEGAFCLWLLVKGLDVDKWVHASRQTAPPLLP